MVFKGSMHRQHNIHHRTKRKRHYKAPFAERGWIQFLILRLLHETPIHGYQLIEEMESRGYVKSGRFETGSIYVMLRRLERKALLSSKNIQTESGRVRRVYTVTDKGEETLKKSLEYIINQKKIHDELADYYRNNFSNPE